MSNRYVAAIQAIGRPVAYYPNLSKAFGSNNVGIFLSQMMYWEGRQRDPDGWILKTQKEIFEETGLSRHEMDVVRKKLRSIGVMEEEKRGIPARMHYRFKWDVVDGVIQDFVETNTPIKIGRVKSNIDKLREVFDVEFNEHPIHQKTGEYNWTEKDYKHLKYIEQALEKRVLKKIEESGKNKDELDVPNEVVNAFRVILQKMPEHYKNNCMSPSAIYSNLSPIMSAIVKESEQRKGKERTSFAERARAHAQ